MTKRCPRCNSPQPHLHPAVQFEGEVEICTHDYHLTLTNQNDQAAIDRVLRRHSEKAAPSAANDLTDQWLEEEAQRKFPILPTEQAHSEVSASRRALRSGFKDGFLAALSQAQGTQS